MCCCKIQMLSQESICSVTWRLEDALFCLLRLMLIFSHFITMIFFCFCLKSLNHGDNYIYFQVVKPIKRVLLNFLCRWSDFGLFQIIFYSEWVQEWAPWSEVLPTEIQSSLKAVIAHTIKIQKGKGRGTGESGSKRSNTAVWSGRFEDVDWSKTICRWCGEKRGIMRLGRAQRHLSHWYTDETQSLHWICCESQGTALLPR